MRRCLFVLPLLALVESGCSLDSTVPGPVETHLAFLVQPSATTWGVAFSPPVVVSINDANNRVLPVDTEVVIYLRGWPQRTISYHGTVSVRSIQGIATFDDLHIDVAGSGYTLSAKSDVAVDSAISDTFSVRFTPAITYSSTRDLSHYDVYGTTLDGSVKVKLTNDSASHSGRWSPDGARVLVESYRTGDLDLYALDSNSLGLTNLTQHAGNDYNGVWFPNSQRVAFLSDRDGDGGKEIYVMNSDGSAQTRLTYDSATIWGPIISPDGTQILYSTWRGNTYNVYVVGADDSNRITLTTDTAPSVAFSWSPRGDQIAFSAGGHLILARPDGSNRREIPGDTLGDTSGMHAGQALFSPDGNRLAIMWYRGTEPNVVLTLEVSNIDGSGRLQLGTGCCMGLLEWSPDGAWLLLSSFFESWSQIGLLKPDGTGGYSLTSGPHDGGAHFRP